MNKVTASFLLTSIVFFVLGYTVSTFLGVRTLTETNEQIMMNHDGHDHTTGDLPHDHSMMEHGSIDLSEAENPPTIDLIVTEDLMSGWNLQIVTTNFTFSPENASLDNVDNEGHAHLYVDGTKITRLYSEWYHLPELSPGTREVTVSLNANDHSELLINEEPISDTEQITVE